jgi:hypothetical protein
MKTSLIGIIPVITLVAITPVRAQLPADAVPVTADNFVRAETDMYFALFVSPHGRCSRETLGRPVGTLVQQDLTKLRR